VEQAILLLKDFFFNGRILSFPDYNVNLRFVPTALLANCHYALAVAIVFAYLSSFTAALKTVVLI
jgi:hypothetical protein